MMRLKIRNQGPYHKDIIYLYSHNGVVMKLINDLDRFLVSTSIIKIDSTRSFFCTRIVIIIIIIGMEKQK